MSWDSVDDQLTTFSQAINELEQLLTTGNYKDKSKVARILEREPTTLDVIRLVFALPGRLDFADGRTVPPTVPTDRRELDNLASLIDEIGVWRLLVPNVNLQDLVKVALVANDARKRRFRMLSISEKRVKNTLTESLKEASERLDSSLTILPDRSGFPNSTLRKVDYVVVMEDTPVAAISTVIQTSTGGRQQRDLRLTYPNLQQELDQIPLKLILIVDGQGIADAPDSVLQDLFMSVHAVMSIRQAEAGQLTEAIISSVTNRGKRSAPISRIIESVLSTGQRILAGSLPVSYDNARIALATYLDDHPELALSLAGRGTALEWERPKLVEGAIALQEKFEERRAIDLICELLNAKKISDFSERLKVGTCSLVSIETVYFLPQPIFIVSNGEKIGEPIFHDVAQESLRNRAQLAVLLRSGNTEEINIQSVRKVQSTLARNVILVTPPDLLNWAKQKRNPRDVFSSVVLEQSDLTKISPFVLQGRTPERMYFGRAAEEATVVNTLTSNSVAIIGSRRTGKTSLMYRIAEQLNAANRLALFADCQTVRDWADFGHLVSEKWGIKLPDEFKPNHLFDMVVQLKSRTENSVIFLLDEIDQLLSWDMSHPSSKVPEAFFRACRTISQEGHAQFVFSGERTIANKLWDPQSPHWNFCRELPLQQLDRDSTEDLLLQPLQSLQITIHDVELFKQNVWLLTSGHPQIAQYLGDRLIRQLNERAPSERFFLTVDDIRAVAETFEFKEHYLETYWGQATKLERLITMLVVSELNLPADIITEAQHHNLGDAQTIVTKSLRMLELYGILRQEGKRFRIRAEWFPEALKSYGDLGKMIELYWDKI